MLTPASQCEMYAALCYGKYRLLYFPTSLCFLHQYLLFPVWSQEFINLCHCQRMCSLSVHLKIPLFALGNSIHPFLPISPPAPPCLMVSAFIILALSLFQIWFCCLEGIALLLVRNQILPLSSIHYADWSRARFICSTCLSC